MKPEDFLIRTAADLEHEQIVLCGMLRDSTAAAELSESMRPDDFSAEGAIIFRAIVSTWEESGGRRIDPELVLKRATPELRLPDDKCRDVLIAILESDPISAAWSGRAQLVRERSLRMQVVIAAQESIAESMSPTTSAEDALSLAQSRFLKIGQQSSKNGTVPFAQAIREVNEAIDRGRHGDGMKGGMLDLDELTGGFHPGELCIVAARPSVGKSAFAVNVATNAAKCGHAGLILSLEMSRLELATRYLCGSSGVQSQHLRKGRLSNDQVQRLIAASGSASALPLWINDTGTLRSREIRAIARKAKAATGTQFIVVDYLQLISADDQRQGRTEQVGEMSRSLKLLARDLEIPVICLSQLNRQVDSRSDPCPKLSDLRESGSIEQDADTVIFLYRLQGDEGLKAPVEEIGVYVAKQRNGPTGKIGMMFRKDTMSFEAKGIPL